MRIVASILCLVMFAACAAPSPDQRLAQLSQASSSDLWLVQRTTPNVDELRLVEFELVRRNELRFGSAYIGSRSALSVGRAIFPRSTLQTGSVENDIYSCSDFPNSISAQRAFIQFGGPASDPNGLDADGDGFACEWGTAIREISRRAQPAPVRAIAPRSIPSRSRCYTGPRGGTYTITSSGARDYDGC